jgi:hypothetical protein
VSSFLFGIDDATEYIREREERMSVWAIFFAVATACWFSYFRSLPHNSEYRSGWRQIPMLLGAGAYGFWTTVGIYIFFHVVTTLGQ